MISTQTKSKNTSEKNTNQNQNFKSKELPQFLAIKVTQKILHLVPDRTLRSTEIHDLETKHHGSWSFGAAKLPKALQWLRPAYPSHGEHAL